MVAFWLCFVPLFVAVDAIGTLPMFVSLTARADDAQRRRIVMQSVLTAGIVAVGFLLLGPSLLRSLGIALEDFMIAGGILLLTISLSDILTGEKKRRQTDPNNLGAVPIGVPLITGPAVLTTCIVLSDIHGKALTAAATVANIVLAGLIFMLAKPITRVLGQTGSKTISKVASLLLAAIAVMLIRKGIVQTIASI